MTVALAFRVVSLESRHAAEMARLLERRGMQVIRAPSMTEAPLTDQHEALAFGEVLLAGECDVLVLLTGVGTRMLVAALATRWPQPQVVAALQRTVLLSRGPKPVAALKAFGLSPALVAPSPNTWRELLAALETTQDPRLALADKRVWVQEYGRPNPQLTAGLQRLGARVSAVPVYGWTLPEDVGPLRAAVTRLCAGEVEAVMFTSARQLDHLLEVAGEAGLREPLLEALRGRVVVASVGPVTSEALREAALPVDIEPEHPKMGHLARAVAERGLECLQAKRG